METEREQNIRRINEALDAEEAESDVMADMTTWKKKRAAAVTTRRPQVSSRLPREGRPREEQ